MEGSFPSRDGTRSKLPSFRHVDLDQVLGKKPQDDPKVKMTMTSLPLLSHQSLSDIHSQHQHPLIAKVPASLLSPLLRGVPSSTSHVRYHSTSSIATTHESKTPANQPSPRPKTSTGESSILEPSFPTTTGNIPVTSDSRQKARIVNIKTGKVATRQDVQWEGPPPAMITQRSYPLESSVTTTTQNWVATQQSPTTSDQQPTTPAITKSNRSSTDNTPSRPRIQPIRGFKPSSRRSVEMPAKRNSVDPDSTIRALEDFEPRRRTNNPEQEEQNSDESDLFLRAAREEELAQNNNINDRLIRSDRRKSQIGQRSSAPPTALFSPPVARRRESDNEGSTTSRLPQEQEGIGQALTYRPSARERPSALDDINRSRYYGANSRSNPTTPRALTSREISPESQVSYGGLRPSIPEPNQAARGTSYRQSNLSYSAARTYNSSPLVSRSTDMHMQDPIETPRVAEGTESTVSTTAPSTVWDELDELKSRIHRLELTGKLPPTSGAAISRASSERPPTATTTVTTMSSSSPKRGRNNSISPIEPSVPEVPEHHPLLHSALEKSKSLVAPEIYKALEAAASDALAISSMMGTSGQPGPLSSQSTVGGHPAVSDRQVRRKADSMCRSLTELCLALSESKNDISQATVRPGSRDADIRQTEIRQSIEPSNTNLRAGTSLDVARVKSSPRAVSRLEARRSSLLTGSALPAPRYSSTEGTTPTQSSMANRRTSLLLRPSRRGTEELDDEDDTRFRAPSRATTDIGRIRDSPRAYISQQPLPERQPAVQSSLPVRRSYHPSGLTNTPPSMPPVSSLGGRRFLDRATPERDTTSSLTSRLAEERAQRKSSIGFPTRTGSLTRKTRQPNSHSADLSAGQSGGYQ